MMQAQAAELKQQGAVEAAQDPNSSVTAEDAERVIVQETKKAGAQAYQFDPNASPEEKAAQARSNIPPGFHHQRQHQALGVVTDIDGDSPAKYDLPSPDKGAALAVTSPKTPNGDLVHTNGHLSETDETQWVERTGWAPRFGSAPVAESEGEGPLDRQTWVEGKLDDKFFGEWYHNTAVIIFACLSSWVVAVLGGGLGWIFIIMACCGTYYRTSIRRVRRNFRDDIEREMAKGRLETDVESLEWINSFLVKFWPIYQPVLADTIIKSVDQVLSGATPGFLDSLRLKTFTLGTKPPRLDHVKTYPKAEDDIVLMDWRFSFTPNDTADLTARQIKNKQNPKVVLEVRIGKAMISTGLDVIVQDMAFSGLLRVKCKLQIPFPHVERVEICFLEQPTIDYVCKPLGGDTLGFDINVIPGLESFIQGQVHGNLRPLMYAPNVFPIEIAKMLSGDAVDRAVGVLVVTLHGAQGLKNPDKFAGTPDPYVAASLNRRDVLAKTKTVKENANPKWGETKYIILTSLHDVLTLQVVDFNEYRKDKELGTASFALEQLEKEPEHQNLQLEVLGNGKARGILQADVRFFPVLEGRKLEDGAMEPPPESNTGIARFTVEQAKDLDGTKSLVGQLNPYAVLLLNGKEVHTTQKLKRTNNPIWPDGFKELLITDRKSAKLGLVIKDNRDLTTDPILGTYQVKLNDLLQMAEKGQEWYYLAGAKTGRVKLALHWKPIALKGQIGGSDGYVTPIGVMRLHFQNGRELRNLETVGKSDPYVRVLLSGIEKARTVTFKSNLNPDWDEVHYVPMHSTRERLTLEVMDEENLGKDRTLGQIELLAADYIEQNENGEYLTHSERRLRSDPLRMHGKGFPKGTLNYTAAFYPCLNVVDPEEEKEKEVEEKGGQVPAEEGVKGAADTENEKPERVNDAEAALLHKLTDGEKDQTEEPQVKELPKIHLTAENLRKYESGLIVFKLIEGEFSRPNFRVEVLMDDMRFPSYSSSKAVSRHMRFEETGDAFVRELDVSRITLRLRAKPDHKGEEENEHVLAKLVGDTSSTLKQCLYTPTVLTLKDPEGGVNKIKVSLKYLPVMMQLDPSESINNMGNLRVDIIDATNLPSADRNGYSDPYCKFILNGKEVFKTTEQKKTLNPVWKEAFETPVRSRIAAVFKVMVYDWDAIGNDDFLGEAPINLQLLEPMVPREYKLALDGKSGTVRLRLLFRPDYVTRSRQGSSTFSGTFGPSHKIVSGVAGAPIKGVGMMGGGVGKGASFFKNSFKSKPKNETGSEAFDAKPETNGETNMETNGDSLSIPKRAPTLNGEPPEPPQVPKTPMVPSAHARSTSFGGRSFQSMAAGKGSGPELGVANFSILSASGYSPSVNVRIHIKQLSPKGSKEVYKTKALSSPSGHIRWENETFRVQCTPEVQFQIQAKDHSTFRNYELGEALFVIDDSTAGSEKTVQVGSGSVVLRTSFSPAEGGGARESPKASGATRRSFLNRAGREIKDVGSPASSER